MVNKECISCIHICHCCTQSSCDTCRPYGLNFRPDDRKKCKVHGDRITNGFMFDVGEKVVIVNLKLISYDGCCAVPEMLNMSGKEAIITKRYLSFSGKVRYHIKGSHWTWSEPMFVPKKSDNRFDWLDEII